MTIQRARASASDTLDATSYTQIDSITLTPGSGNYLAVFSMDVQYSASPGEETMAIAIYVDGVQQAHSVRQIQQNSSLADTLVPVITSAYVTPGDSEVVEVKYIASSASNPMFGTNRELDLFPAITISQLTDVVDDTLASATWTTLDTMTTTPASGDYLLVFTTWAETEAFETVGFRLSVDGSPVAHTERQIMVEGSAQPGSYCTMIAASISPNGSQVVEIEWSRINGSGTVTCHERNMILVTTSSTYIFQATGTVDDTDSTSGSDVLIDDMTITDPGVDDYLVLFSSFQFYPDLTARSATIYKTYVAGVAVSFLTRTFEHEDSIDSCQMSVFMTGRITTVTGVDDIQVYWQGDTTTQRTIYERTLVAIRETPITYKLEGITYDKNESVLGSVDCHLYKDNGDNTVSFVDYVLSNAGTGAYSFTGIGDNDASYLVVFIKDDSPAVFDVTDHVLQPVVE